MVAKRFSFGRSWGAFGPSWSQKVAKNSEGQGDEGKRSERRGKGWRQVVADLLARKGGSTIRKGRNALECPPKVVGAQGKEK